MIVTDENVFAVDQRDAPRPDPLPAMDRTRELGTLRFDRTPARHLGGAGRRCRGARPGRHSRQRRDARRRRPGARHDRRVRQGPGAVRQADRLLPGGQAHAGRLPGRRGGHAVDRLLRRLVRRRRRPRALTGRQHGQGLVLRRLTARDGLRPAGARRHRLHLGARHAPLPEAGPARPGQLRRRRLPP